MKKISKMFLFVLLGMMIMSLVACNKEEKKDPDALLSEEPTDEKKSETATESGNEYKHENRALITNLAATASTSDPFAHANVVDRTWLLNAYEPLFCYNGLVGEHEPRVGKSYEISEDGLTYTVEIFDNVYFQNGKHCTAEDVQRSFEYAKKSTYNTQFSGAVDRVEIINDYEVDIILSEPSSPFLSNSDQIFILDMDEVEAQGDQFGLIANKAGTGAYYIDQYDPSVEIVMKYHDKFHRPLADGKRAIPEIIFKVMTDSSAVAIAFESGDLDFIAVPPSAYAAIEESGKYNTYLGQTTQLVYLVMNPHNEDMLSNKLVRQAIAYGMNYEDIRAAAMEGMGDITGKLAHPDFTIAAPKGTDGTVYTYNPDKAKELLAEAGYPDGGIDVGSILCTAGSNREKMAQVIQENMVAIGITIGIDPREQVTGIADMREGKYQTGIMGFYLMMDYDYVTGNWDIDGNTVGMVKITDAKDFDWQKIVDLIHAGRATTDVEERRAYYVELEEILMDAAIQIPLLHTALPYAWDKELYLDTNKPYTYHYSQFWNAYWE